MQFKSIIGQKELISNLISSFKENRVAHTQLFLGGEGYGPLPLAIAFSQFLLCINKQSDDSCGVCPSCKKFDKYAHPDLHFYFPTATNQTIKKNPKSSFAMDVWRNYLVENNAYITLNGWLENLGVGNKQGYLRKDDANEIIGQVALKAFEGSYKIFIIWMVDKMNEPAANKLLKTFEEPPKNTIIILITEKYEQLLPTVRSRAQLVKVQKLSIDEITNKLIETGVDSDHAYKSASLANGSWNTATEIAEKTEDENSNFINFRKWLRLCYQPKDYDELLRFNQEISKLGREKQKSFLNYGLEIIHNSILINHNQSENIKKTGDELNFTKNFSKFINEANQRDMYNLFNEAIFHIERNAHSGIMYSDMSFKITDLIISGRKYVAKN